TGSSESNNNEAFSFYLSKHNVFKSIDESSDVTIEVEKPFNLILKDSGAMLKWQKVLMVKKRITRIKRGIYEGQFILPVQVILVSTDVTTIPLSILKEEITSKQDR